MTKEEIGKLFNFKTYLDNCIDFLNLKKKIFDIIATLVFGRWMETRRVFRRG